MTAAPRVLPRLGWAVASLGLLLAACAFAGLLVGAGASPGQAVESLWIRLLGKPAPAPQVESILWQIRFPRVVMAATVGGALSLAGASLQGLLMNPLADPYLVGTSSGAALGAVLAMLLGLGLAGLGVPLAGFLAALGTMGIVFLLSQRKGALPLQSFLLAGVVVGSFLWALVSLLLSLAGQDLATMVRWLMGSLFVVTWGQIWPVLGLTWAGAFGLWAFARDLNLMALGEEPARQLGVEVEQTKRAVIALASLVTAAAVSVAGIIGFIGLIVPHIARKLFGPDHRVLLPAAGLLGAGFLIVADALARLAGALPTLAIGELPVGVITSLVGAPFFLYLLRRR